MLFADTHTHTPIKGSLPVLWGFVVFHLYGVGKPGKEKGRGTRTEEVQRWSFSRTCPGLMVVVAVFIGPGAISRRYD